MRTALIRIVLCLGAIMVLTLKVSAFSGGASFPAETDPIEFFANAADSASSVASPERSTEDKRPSCQHAHCHTESLMAGAEIASPLRPAKRRIAVFRNLHFETIVVDMDERPPTSRDL